MGRPFGWLVFCVRLGCIATPVVSYIRKELRCGTRPSFLRIIGGLRCFHVGSIILILSLEFQVSIGLKHKHACSNGHQLRAMGGITVDGKPSFQTCDEIPDGRWVEEFPAQPGDSGGDPEKKPRSVWTTWKDIKGRYPEWQYEFFEHAEEQMSNLRQFRLCWDFHGREICDYFQRERGIAMQFCDLRVRDLHAIFVVEDDQKGVSHVCRLLQHNQEAKEQFCSIVLSNNLTQTLVVAERPFSQVVKNGKIVVDRSDLRSEETSVLRIFERAETYDGRAWFLRTQYMSLAVKCFQAHVGG